VEKGGDILALDVINSLIEAETKADLIISEAEAKKKDIIKAAEQRANEEYSRIITEANSEAKGIIDDAVLDVQKEVEPIKERGKQEEETILNLSYDKLNKAVDMVIERIVKTNGNS
jgi:V/A-type H+-transporting ATPase subunit G/H